MSRGPIGYLNRLPSGVIEAGIAPDGVPPIGAIVVPLFNVTEAFRAAGDGARDDGPGIQAAIDAAHRAGGGIVYLPAGTYLLGSLREQPGIRFYLLNMHSNVTLLGAGRRLTVLRAGADLPDQTRIISADSANGQSFVFRSGFQDFTLDGSADAQPGARSCVGISNVHTKGNRHLRVDVHDVKGTVGAEGTAFDSFFSSANVYVDCKASRAGSGPTGSGFSATHSTSIAYHDCRASGSTSWQGFTAYASSGLDYLNCHGYENAQRGLNCEESDNVRYANCRAGGSDRLGNTGDGFYLYKSNLVALVTCAALGNQTGVVNQGSTAVRVTGGDFRANLRTGFGFGSEADTQNCVIEGQPVVGDNRLGAMAVGSTVYGSLPS
jgi:hypothetical protein